jgi:hypothetical protein
VKPEPAHEPVIPKSMYDEPNARRAGGKGSREGIEPNSHPATRHSHLLRGMVFCQCGRRMYGNARRRST